VSPKIGYLLPTREQIMEGRPETGPLIALSERAETLGYDSIWVGDSLLARPRHDPLTLLAGVATRTRRVQLGTAVLLPALRNPIVLAQQIATLDQLSEGRIILGVGIGLDLPSVHAEFAAAGVPFEKRVGRPIVRWLDADFADCLELGRAMDRCGGCGAGRRTRRGCRVRRDVSDNLH